MDSVEEIKKNKKSVTLRLEEDTDEIIRLKQAWWYKIRNCRNINKKYAKEEYGSF